MLDFEGDVLFTDSPDGGQIAIEDGLVKCDRSFSTAVYLSLFGGNKEDDGKVENTKGWWGNYTEGALPEERLTSRFQTFATKPLSSANIRLAERAAVADLSWLKDDGIADEVDASGIIDAVHHAVFTITVKKGGETVLKTKYGIQWEAGIKNGV